jgi:hypothetical protein
MNGAGRYPNSSSRKTKATRRDAGCYSEPSTSALQGRSLHGALRTPKMQNLADKGRGLQIYRSRKEDQIMILLVLILVLVLLRRGRTKLKIEIDR